MKKILPFLLLIMVTLTLNPAFQSLVDPRLNSPFSTTFDVINPVSYPPYNYSPYSNQYNTERVIFVQPSAIPFSNRGFQSYFSSLPGYSSTPSIVYLKDFPRKIDGSENNLNHISYNSANTGLARHTPALYKDGKSIPMGSDVSPRETSNTLGRIAPELLRDPNNVTAAFVIWGQFLDHDVGLTEVNDK